MKRVIWTLAPLLALICASESQAQFLPYYSYGGGYGFGGGLGFSYHRRGLSLFGGLGGFSSGFYGASTYIQPFGSVIIYGPYAPPVYSYGPPVLMPPAVAGAHGRQRPPTLEEETAGIDLDLVPAEKPSQKVEPAPEPAPFKMPGKDVSKQVPPVRPGDLPPPKKQAPPMPPKEVPKQEPPPPAGPKQQSAHLTTLGLAAFSAQAYGLATHRFRQATAADPKGARAYFLLAQSQFALGKYPQAVESIHAGMRLHKNWPRAPFQPRVDLYRGIEADFAEQLKRLEGAVKQAPKQPALRFLLAYQLWFDGRRIEAIAQFQQARALTADPSFIDQFLAAVAPKQVVLK